MHESAVAQSLLDLAEEAAAKSGCNRLVIVRVEYGPLAGIEPDSLRLCFEILIKGTVHEGARLDLVLLPLRLRCPFCDEVFGGEGREALHAPCPGCGEIFGHIVEQGRELILSRLEAVKILPPAGLQ